MVIRFRHSSNINVSVPNFERGCSVGIIDLRDLFKYDVKIASQGRFHEDRFRRSTITGQDTHAQAYTDRGS